MDALWFVHPTVRPMIQPGDEVTITGFRQYRIARNGEEIFFGAIAHDAKLVVE